MTIGLIEFTAATYPGSIVCEITPFGVEYFRIPCSNFDQSSPMNATRLPLMISNIRVFYWHYFITLDQNVSQDCDPNCDTVSEISILLACQLDRQYIKKDVRTMDGTHRKL